MACEHAHLWGKDTDTKVQDCTSRTNAPLTLPPVSTPHHQHVSTRPAVCPKLKAQSLSLQAHAVRDYCHFLNLTTTRQQTIMSVTTKLSFCPRDLNCLCRRV